MSIFSLVNEYHCAIFRKVYFPKHLNYKGPSLQKILSKFCTPNFEKAKEISKDFNIPQKYSERAPNLETQNIRFGKDLYYHYLTRPLSCQVLTNSLKSYILPQPLLCYNLNLNQSYFSTTSSQTFHTNKLASWSLLGIGCGLTSWGVVYGLYLIFYKPTPVKITIDSVRSNKTIREEMGEDLWISRFWQGYIYKKAAYIRFKVYGKDGSMGVAMSDFYRDSTDHEWIQGSFKFFKSENDSKKGSNTLKDIKDKSLIHHIGEMSQDMLAAQVGHSVDLEEKKAFTEN